MLDLKILEDLYPTFKQEGFENKWLNYADLLQYFEVVNFNKEEIGKSFLGLPIYKLSIGSGSTRILIWSQMHGNESTGTRAMFDVLNFLKSNHNVANIILDQVTIDFIPMLNPDGANLNTRRNAIGIDINRDFLKQQSTEIHVLLNQVEKQNYSVLFNLHDQRTIFSVGNTNQPATLSFLAPSYNVEEDVNQIRQKTMGIIQAIYTDLQAILPGKIGRYTSEFYPMSTGDNFTKLGYPCVLFEAGHYPNDYQRNETRKYNALAIISGLFAIGSNQELKFDHYESIPQNGQKFLDVIIRNIKISHVDNQSLVDFGIYFEDVYDEFHDQYLSKGKLIEIGDLRNFYGHLEIDAKGSEFIGESFPKLNQFATFNIGSYQFLDGHLI